MVFGEILVGTFAVAGGFLFVVGVMVGVSGLDIARCSSFAVCTIACVKDLSFCISGKG